MAKKKGATNRVQQQKPKTKKYTTNGTESFDTEQDTWEKDREKIQLDPFDDNEYENDEEEEEIFGLGAGSDEDDEEEEEEEEEDELDDDNLEEILGEPKKIQDISDKAWGKKRKNFYEADTLSDEEALKEEEEEAKRLQEEKISGMREEDFLDDFNSFSSQISKTQKKKKETQVVPEKIEKNFTTLNKDEIIEILVNDSPEFMDLFGDLKEKIEDIRTNLKPLLDKVQNGELEMSKGISFLELKYHLMLSYCTNISFYLLLKAKGEKVKNHPVFDQLVQLRTVMEKIKPLEQKLKHQIEKLVKIANTGALPKDDPLRFKPNPFGLLNQEGDEEEEEGETETKDGVYKPSKFAPVHYEEEKPNKKVSRQLERQKRKLKEHLEEMDDHLDLPEEIVYREELDDFDRKQKEQEEHEEEYFNRMPVKKKAQKKKSKLENELENLNDFGDISVIEKDLIPQKKTKIQDTSILDALNEDMEDPLDFNDDSDYEQFKADKKKKKEEKEERKKMFQFQQDPEEAEEIEDETGKRTLTQQMLKNRGLTPKRKKEIKNPRVKKRVKYEEAQNKLKHISKKAGEQMATYQGERTGIKTNLSRSVKIK